MRATAAAVWVYGVLACALLPSCKHGGSTAQDFAPAASGRCEVNGDPSKNLGLMFGRFLANPTSNTSSSRQAGAAQASLLGALPGLLGLNIAAVTPTMLTDLKNDVDHCIGQVVTDLNQLSQEQLRDSLDFFSLDLAQAVDDINDNRFKILNEPAHLDAYAADLATAYAQVKTVLDHVTLRAATESSVVFMAAANDLTNAHAYFVLADSAKVLNKVLAPSSGLNASTKAIFIRNFDLLAESYINYLRTMAARKRAATEPIINITQLSGHRLEASPILSHWITKNSYVPYSCPYPVRVPSPPKPLTVIFHDDGVATLQYRYETFGGNSGIGQINPSTIEGVRIDLHSRPADPNVRTGYDLVLLNACDAKAFTSDSSKVSLGVAAALEANAVDANHPVMASIMHGLTEARDLFDSIHPDQLDLIVSTVSQYLASEPRLNYHFDPDTGTGVPALP